MQREIDAAKDWAERGYPELAVIANQEAARIRQLIAENDMAAKMEARK